MCEMYPAISVVVPVYKAELYLRKCVDSILSQTFSNYELILVDDGSPDSSGAICDEYANLCDKVVVVHKINGGVSSARQCGLDRAKGQYVIHVDPDDWVDSDMLEELYKAAVSNNADMLICDFYEDCNGISKYVSQQPSSLDHNRVLYDVVYKLHGSCCNKLVRRELFHKYQISFPEQFSLHEDLYVTIALLKENISVSYLSRAFYHYCIGLNQNSLVKSGNYNMNILNEDINKHLMFCDLMKGHELYTDVKNRMSVYVVNRAYNCSSFSSKEFKTHMSIFYKDIMRVKNIALTTKIRLLLSCIGFYRLMRIVGKYL